MALEHVGRYQIKSELGRGGMSTVYLAHDPNVDRLVALKLLPREFLHHETFRERFNREARIIAALEHPAIVPIYDFGEEAGQPYFVMRYMSGGSLADRLRGGPLSIADTSHILERIGSALDHAHKEGIIHRDLKPANILFDQYNQAYLGDFGIARLQETGSTLTGTVYLGTPAYMSPEQVQSTSDLDGRSDIYALGVILYEVLTGQKPYRAETAAGLALKHVSEPVPSVRLARPDLPASVEEVISRAMAKRREDRFPTAVDLTSAVATLARTESASMPADIDATMVADFRPPTAGGSPATAGAPTGSGAAAAAATAGGAATAAGAATGAGVAQPAPTPTPVPTEEETSGRRASPLLIAGLIVLAVICLAAGLVGLGAAAGSGPFAGLFAAEAETPTPMPTATRQPTDEPTNTATAEPPTATTTLEPTETNTPRPSATPTEALLEPTLRPTFTPRPTNTSLPTFTPTPLPTNTPLPPPTNTPGSGGGDNGGGEPPPPTPVPPPATATPARPGG